MSYNFWLEILKDVLVLLWKIWPIWTILLIVVAFRIFGDSILPKLLRLRKSAKNKKWLSGKDYINKIRKYSPKEFEDYIAWMFREMGFKTESVGGSYDGGIDVIAEKDGIKHYIQCKKFIIQEVGVGAMRDFYGAIAGKVTNGKGYFITTNKFTLEAERFAEDKPIELVDQYKLIKWREEIAKK
ncbi:MAG TPA: restriction endonuclease [Candidatus Paceibacterota bacterium]